MMQEFEIDVVLSRGLTRLQVEAIPPAGWDMPGCPQFLIEFHTGRGWLSLTIQLEYDTWHDRNTRLPEDQFYLRYLELGPAETWNPNYESPISTAELQNIGKAISDQLIIRLNAYLGLFYPVYRTPTLN